MIDHLNGMSLDLIWVVLCFQLKINVLELEGIGYVFIIMSWFCQLLSCFFSNSLSLSEK